MQTKAIATPTTPAAGRVTHVATSFKAFTETRELGEAYAVMKVADDNLKQFEKCLEMLRGCGSERRRKTAQTMFEIMGDARHDASWASTLSLAADAAVEARVVPMVRK